MKTPSVTMDALERVNGYIAEITSGAVRPVTLEDRIAELTLDSLDLAEIVSAYAEDTGAAIDMTLLDRTSSMETVGDLIAALLPTTGTADGAR